MITVPMLPREYDSYPFEENSEFSTAFLSK